MRFAVISLLALSVPGFAQLVEDQSPARVGVSATERRMTLEDAIQMALQNNLAIEIERTNVDRAVQLLKGAHGVYDPRLLYVPSLETRNIPTSSVLISPTGKLTEHEHRQDVSFLQRTPWQGASLRVDFENSRLSTNNPFVGLNPNTASRLSLGITVPLWRGRSIDPERAEIRIRAKQQDVSKTDLELQVISITTQVQDAYWGLVAALSNRSVRRDGVKLAREQYARSQRQIDAGTLAPVELAAAEAELQRRIDSYVISVNVVTQTENRLKLLLAPSREDALWIEQILPVDERPIEPPTTELHASVKSGLDRRPELRALRLLMEANDVSKELARNLTKPQVNLEGGYATAGLAGQVSTLPNPFSSSQAATSDRLNELSVIAGLPPLPPTGTAGPPPALIGGYGKTLSNLFGGSYYTVSGGLRMDFNFRNRAANAEVAQAAIAERRLKLQERQAQQIVEADVRNALQSLESADQRIKAAELSERAAQEKLDSEIRLFQTGESTNFLVLTRQNEYLESRTRVVLAVLEYNRSIAELEKATAITMERHKIALH